MEIEAEDWELFRLGPAHKPGKAGQQVPYPDFEEAGAVKVTNLGEGGG